VRLGLSFPALIQRRIVGDEIDMCLQAAAVLTQGSDSEVGTVCVLVGFMVFERVLSRAITIANSHLIHHGRGRGIRDAPNSDIPGRVMHLRGNNRL
jgi:hypothetical protein